MSEWISVENKLPKNNNKNFVVILDEGDQKRYAIASYYFEQKGSRLFKKREAFWEVYRADTIMRPFFVSHWMPLPEPPEDS